MGFRPPPEAEEVVIKRGEMVTCPECGRALAEVVRDIHRFQSLSETMFGPVEGSPELKNGDRTASACCHVGWFMHGRIHTQSGWKP